MLTAREPAGRSTNIRGYGHQDQKDQDEAYQKTKEFPPPLFPHAHHPLYQGVANRLCMYSAPFAGTDPVAPCGVGCIIGCVRALSILRVIGYRRKHTVAVGHTTADLWLVVSKCALETKKPDGVCEGRILPIQITS